MMPRVSIITAGHLATCPRMLKAADALAAAGYGVRVVSTRHLDWAVEADADVRRRRGDTWAWTVVDYGRQSARSTYLRSGLRRRAARSLAWLVGPARCPAGVAARAWGRVHDELVQAALAEPVDLFYGGTAGALAAVAAAGGAAGVPYALDLEDLHSAERAEDAAGQRVNALADRIERVALPGAAFLTAASPAIAVAYGEKYGLTPIPVHNVFPLPARPPDPVPSPGEGLRLGWFSQTIGPGRGLEDTIRAMHLADLPGELHLRGRAIPGYLRGLKRLAEITAPRLKVVLHEPAPPDAMVELCRGLDIGLAVEPGFSLNNRLALSNKAFTYVLAGLAVVLTDTPGQRALAGDLGPAALLYAPGDVPALARGLRRWARDKAALARAKAAAWEAARRRWHWEHPAERGALLSAVAAALGSRAPCA